MATPLRPAVALRPVVPADRDALLAVYAAARAPELDQVAWPPGLREAFVAMQYDAQDAHYRAANPDASFDVVEVDGRLAGRLTVDRRRTDVRVVDLALLPEQRGRGVGTLLLRAVQAEAAASGRTVSIHVERDNPAARLYDRLGFRQVEDRGVHRLLEWRPSGEGGLVAAGTDRHQEEGELAELVVPGLPGALGESRRPVEDERELTAGLAVGAAAALVPAEHGLAEHERVRLPARQPDGERGTDQGGEVVVGEPAHPTTVDPAGVPADLSRRP